MPPNSSSAATVLTPAAFAAAGTTQTPSSLVAASAQPLVRLFSLTKAPTNAKVLHLIRHAEGRHNVACPERCEYKLPSHWDASLTPRGVEQCRQLAKRIRSGEAGNEIRNNVDCVVISPMTRCLQTAMLSLSHLRCRDGFGVDDASNAGSSNASSSSPSAAARVEDIDTSSSSRSGNTRTVVPFIAHESWRETVNFLCDSRRPLPILRSEFPAVNFDSVQHDDDPLWHKYQIEYGDHLEFDGMRESTDGMHLYRRAREAWTMLSQRPERNVVVVGHSAFFMHMFQPYLDEMMGVVEYADDEVRALMMDAGFGNCELKSVAFEIP